MTTEPNWDEIDFPIPGKPRLLPFRCPRCRSVSWWRRDMYCLGLENQRHPETFMKVIDLAGVPRQQTPGQVVA